MSIFNKIQTDLTFALDNKYNVLLSGKHGCGKTLTIIEIFNKKYGEGNWVYMSAPTLDPFVDFIGCPRVVKGKDGTEFLRLIKPERFAYDNVRAIFIDEIPRAQDKVKNALMEILLFKSVNGQKYKNLDVIWAAENPVDEGYSGEELDRAIRDRFHLQIDFPYEINYEYFAKTFNPKTAEIAKDWWDHIEEKHKIEVSPRRLEAALNIILAGGDVHNALPKSCNPGKLLKEIKSGHIVMDELKKLLRKKNNDNALIKFFEEENNYFSTKDYIIQKNNKLLKYISDERLVELVFNNEPIRKYVLEHLNDAPKYMDVINHIVEADTNKELTEEIKKDINYLQVMIEKEHNNPALLALEDELRQKLNIDNVTIYNNAKEIESDAKFADLDTLDYDAIYKFIEKNDKAFAGSEFADEIVFLIKQKYGSKYPNADTLATTIREYGC